jgi:chemotaxis methyl-accepting protein methylase
MVQALAVNPLVAQSDAVLSDEEFAKFCEYFYRKTGIMFDAKKKYFAERRIIDRMNKTGCATFRRISRTCVSKPPARKCSAWSTR